MPGPAAPLVDVHDDTYLMDVTEHFDAQRAVDDLSSNSGFNNADPRERRTRTGRVVRTPTHMKNYIVD
jgi:hypothetical protein